MVVKPTLSEFGKQTFNQLSDFSFTWLKIASPSESKFTVNVFLRTAGFVEPWRFSWSRGSAHCDPQAMSACCLFV